MALLVNHNVKNGIYRLLHAPDDVRPSALPPGGAKRPSEAHRALFRAYLDDLEEVYATAEASWNATVEEEIENGLELDDAILRSIELNGVAGPANHPAVVWLIRKYWLACDLANADLAAGFVAPQHFLLDWLIREARDDYVILLTAMPYWPIGLDVNGNWC